jgi:hypothetical protein
MKTSAGFPGRKLKRRKPRQASPRESESVRHPDEPQQADDRREHVVRDDLHRETGGECDPCRPKLGRELDPRRQRVDVVDQTRDEEQRGAAEDPEQLLVCVNAAGGDRHGDAGGEAEEDPDASEGRGRVLAPALTRWVGDEPPGDGRVEEQPNHERGHGQCDRCCGGTHGRHRNRAV